MFAFDLCMVVVLVVYTFRQTDLCQFMHGQKDTPHIIGVIKSMS